MNFDFLVRVVGWVRLRLPREKVRMFGIKLKTTKELFYEYDEINQQRVSQNN